MRVVEIGAGDTHELRRRVLRDGHPHADVRFPEDEAAGAVHLAAVGEGGVLLAVASFSPQPAAHLPRLKAMRLRGLAVEPLHQQAGVGRALLDAAVDRLGGQGYQVLWANGRDSVLGFYRRLGWQVVGEGFSIRGRPHHVVSLIL